MKKIFLAIGILLFILIVAAIVAPYFISADTLKKTLVEKIETETGRHITIDGKFQLKFFPVVEIAMDGVTLSNPPSYGDKHPLMTFKSIDVGVAVMPLLKGNIEIKKLVLDEPRINLHVSKEGIKNWQPPRPIAPPAPSVNQPPAASSARSVPLPHNLMLNDVKIADGTVTYEDESVKQQWNVQKMNAALSLSGMSSPFTVDASSEWNGKKIAIKGTLATLQSFLNQDGTKIDAEVTSDLLSLTVHGLINGIIYTGNAEVKSPSLKALAAWINPAGAPLQTPAKLALNLSSAMECSTFNCNLTNANLTLDNIQATGTAKVSQGEKVGERPQIDVNLTTGVLDFNPFLSQHADASNGLLSDAYAETGGRWSDKPMDLSALQAINGTASIVADGIVVNKITLGKTPLRAKLENGQLGINIVNADAYGGKGNITANVNAAAPMPTLESNTTLKGIQVQPLFKDAADMSRLSGTADIAFAVSSHGRSEKDFIGALGGNGQFALNNGAIEGVDLTNIIANKPGGGAQKTPITDMKGTFTIAQGVITNKDLTMTLPTLHVSGQGDVNLPAYNINYHLTPQVVQAAGQGSAAKQGIGVPVIVEGSLDKPSFRPDLNAVAQEALKNPQAFKDQLKNTRDSLKDGLKNPDAAKNLKNLLQGF